MRAGQTTYIDDGSTPASSESEQSFTAAVKHAAEICSDRLTPFFKLHRADWAEHTDAGVVDQDIELPVLRIDELEQRRDLFMLANIGSFALDFTAGLLCQFLDCLIDG